MKFAEGYCYSPLDGMLLHCRVTPSSMLLVPIYTLGWRETNWSKLPCVREPDGWDLNPGPPDLECEAWTAQPLMPPPKKNKFCLHQFSLQEIFFPEITLELRNFFWILLSTHILWIIYWNQRTPFNSQMIGV